MDEPTRRRATALLGLVAWAWVPLGLTGLSAPPGLVALPVAAVVVAGAVGFGALLLRLLGAWARLDRERWVWAALLGLGVTGSAMASLAGVDRFSTGTAVVVVAAGLVALVAHGRALVGDQRRPPAAGGAGDSARWGAGWYALLAPAAALVVVRAAAPPSFYDALVYHLGLPMQFAARGGSFVTPHDHYTAMPLLAELAASPALLMGGPEAHGAVYALEWLLLVVAVGVFVRRALPTAPAGSAGAAGFVCASMPLAVFLPSATKPDLLAALWALLALRAVVGVGAPAAASRGAWARVGAAAAGFGCATKTTFLLWLVPVGVVAVAVAWRARRSLVDPTPPATTQGALLSSLGAVVGPGVVGLAFGAWPYVRNAVRLGDPLYPFGPWRGDDGPAWLDHTRALLAGDARPVRDLDALLALPGQLAFGRDPTSNEALGLVVVTGLPLLLLHRATLRALAPALVVAALTLLPWCATHALPRYDPFLWLALGVAGGLGLAHARAGGRAGTGIVAAAAVLAGVQWHWNLAVDDSLLRGPGQLLTQRRTRAEFLAGALELAPAYAFVGEHARGGCVFLATGDARIAYLEVPALVSEVYTRPLLDVLLAEASSAPAVVERLRALGATHVVLGRSARARLQRRGWSGGDAAVWQALPAALGAPLYKDEDAAVFALSPSSPASATCNVGVAPGAGPSSTR